jgi:hypothetical protein
VTLAGDAGHDAGGGEGFQPAGEDGAGDVQVVDEVGVAACSPEGVADDEQGPSFADDFEGAGLYLSLGPSLAAQTTGSPNPLWGGLVIFLLCGTAAVAAFALRGISSRAAMLVGCLFLFVGTAVTFGAIATTTSAAFLAGTAVAGVGVGLAFLGAFRVTTALATPGQRAGLVAAIFTVLYLAFSVPALIAGIATTAFGLHTTALVYSASLAALAAAATGILVSRPGGTPPRRSSGGRAQGMN